MLLGEIYMHAEGKGQAHDRPQTLDLEDGEPFGGKEL